MIPVNIWGAVFFLVLVAPGLLYDLLVDTRGSRKSESAFREISRVVLASLSFSAVPLILLALIGDLGWWDFLPDPSRWATSGVTYAVHNYAPIVFSLFVQFAASCSLAYGWYRIRYRGSPQLNPTPTWRKVFRDDNPTGNPPVARVKTASGTSYEGVVADYTQTFEEDRDLVLSPPLKVKPVGGTMTDMPAAWGRVVIPSSSVQVITVRYPSGPDTVAAPEASQVNN